MKLRISRGFVSIRQIKNGVCRNITRMRENTLK